ncbi:DUF2493 domain-containing protein [Amycolatopsis kentuckyensis]|uniref:DUF2493 domain-containing protein n=1 Tax=Amycolatopsis kentuckyensis TaxID=218823 RepID=UPI003567A608
MTTRVLLTGSRAWTDWRVIGEKLDYLDLKYPDLMIVHGACPRGADDIADRYARAHGIRTERHPANWRKHGRRAGHVRNAHMVALGAELCIAFIRDASPGASGCAAMAEHSGIPTIRFTEGSAA